MSIATVAIAAAAESLALCVGLGSGGVSSSSCGGRKGRRRRPRSGGGWVWVCLLAGLGLPRALLVWLRVYRVRNSLQTKPRGRPMWNSELDWITIQKYCSYETKSSEKIKSFFRQFFLIKHGTNEGAYNARTLSMSIYERLCLTYLKICKVTTDHLVIDRGCVWIMGYKRWD